MKGIEIKVTMYFKDKTKHAEINGLKVIFERHLGNIIASHDFISSTEDTQYKELK